MLLCRLFWGPSAKNGGAIKAQRRMFTPQLEKCGSCNIGKTPPPSSSYWEHAAKQLVTCESDYMFSLPDVLFNRCRSTKYCCTPISQGTPLSKLHTCPAVLYNTKHAPICSEVTVFKQRTHRQVIDQQTIIGMKFDLLSVSLVETFWGNGILFHDISSQLRFRFPPSGIIGQNTSALCVELCVPLIRQCWVLGILLSAIQLCVFSYACFSQDSGKSAFRVQSVSFSRSLFLVLFSHRCDVCCVWRTAKPRWDDELMLNVLRCHLTY